MNTKLTLNLNKEVIERAKKYAKSNHVSLSKLIENYLSSLIKKEKEATKISPLVEILTGVISEQPSKKNQQDYFDSLNEKYS